MHHLAYLFFLSLANLSLAAVSGRKSLTLTPRNEFIIDETNQVVLRTTASHASLPSLTLKSVSTTIYRPKSLASFIHARQRSIVAAQSEPVEWDIIEVPGPDIEDQHTIVQLARMAGNAYSTFPEQKKKNWYEVDPQWNIVRGPCSRLYLM
jgi:putative lipase involved disintegration of autophagic bodies